MTVAIRSPSYPNTSLRDAIEQVRKIEAQYRLSPVDREVAAKVLGYSGLNGPSNKALAALAHYGLVERAGKGEMRVTERAQALLHPDSEEERCQHLRAAALEPQLYRELADRWPNMIPPEEGVVSYLSRKGFNQNSLRPAARAYLNTLLFLKEERATESHRTEASDVEKTPKPAGGRDETTYGSARVGDWINYESGGAIANPEPMRVRAVSEDGKWVFVDGSEAGLEMDQVIVTKPAEDAEAKTERPTLPLPKRPEEEQSKPGTRKAVFPLDDGDVALIFPEDISADGLKELGAYLEIFLKKEVKKKQAD